MMFMIDLITLRFTLSFSSKRRARSLLGKIVFVRDFVLGPLLKAAVGA